MYGDLIREMQSWGGWPGTSIFDELDQMLPSFGFPFGRGPLDMLQFPTQMHPQIGAPSALFPRNMMEFDFPTVPTGSNCHSFMRQSVVSMSSGPDGRPQIYEETFSSTMAPGGIKETKKTVSDSRTGTKRMAIGHQIGERAHFLERERNVRSGEEEERQEFINLDEDEVESFNREWVSRARGGSTAAINSPSAIHGSASSRHQPKPRQLALPSTSTDQQPSTSKYNNPGWKTNLRHAKKSLGKISSTSRTLAKGSSKKEEGEETQSESLSASNSRKRKGLDEDDQFSVRKHSLMKKTK